MHATRALGELVVHLPGTPCENRASVNQGWFNDDKTYRPMLGKRHALYLRSISSPLRRWQCPAPSFRR